MKLRKLITSIALVAIIQHASAQQLQATLSHFSTEDGLCSNNVEQIVQDDYGYIWLGTWNGLSRFDGYNFYNYQTGNRSRIKNLHNRIQKMVIDQSQNIWMRMYDNRVFVLNRATDQIINPFEAYNGYEDFRANSPFYVTSSGEVLVSIKGSGLYILRLDRRGLQTELATTGGLSITSMTEGYQSDIWLGTDKGIYRLDRSNLSLENTSILSNEKISALHSNGFNIFAATTDGRIYSFAYGQEPQLIRQASGIPIIELFIDSHDIIWFSDDRLGASSINLKTGEEKLFQQTVLVPEYDGLYSHFHENNGTVWVRMNHGGYGYFNRETNNVEYFHNDPSNSWNLSNTVYASVELPEGVIWLSTRRRGLEKLEILRNNIIRKRPVPNAVSNLENEIRTMYYDKQRHLLLLGTKNSTLYIYKQDSTCTTITTDNQGRSLGRLYGISKDSKGNYWLCSKDNGVYKMSPRNGGGWDLQNYCHKKDDKWSLSSNAAYQAIEDRQGNIWVATYSRGVNLLTKDKNNKEIFLHCDNEMHKYPHDSYNKVRTLALDKDGNVWAGSTDGILILSYKNNKVEVEKIKNSKDTEHTLMSNDIICIKRDEEGRMWIGSNSGGLSHTIGKDNEGCLLFDTFDTKSGLPSDEIRSITFDQRGNAWFATDHVICSYDSKKNTFSTFSSLDGVDETELSEGAAITLDNDEILFGTVNGYYLVDRKKLMASTGSLLKLRITDFFLDEELQSPRLNGNFKEFPPECRSIKVPRGANSFSFRFAALNYQLQHRVHYQYMLEGYDKDWQNAGKDRMALYENVPGGTYIFKVKAFLLESPEKYDMRTMEVVVPSFFSMTAIWIILIILTLILLLGFAFNHRIRNRFQRVKSEKEFKKTVFEEETDEYEVIDASDVEEK